MKTEDVTADRYQCVASTSRIEVSWEGGRLYKHIEKGNVTEWYLPIRTWDGRKGDEGHMPMGNWS